MPIYPFKCEKCGKTFDKFIKFEEIKNVKCCEVQATRIFTPVEFQLRGAGFYVNDYKKQQLSQEITDSGV